MNLFPVHLEASGTSDVESLASYMHRLAYEHGVYVGELIRYVLGAERGHAPGQGFYRKPQELVRPSHSTKCLSAEVGRSTSQSLMCSMLWFLDRPLSLSAEETCEGFRWCPSCFREMASVGQSPYFKLIWHMSALTHCQIHGRRLESLCPRCGVDQSTYKKQYPLDRCQHCSAALWQSQVVQRDVKPDDSWRRDCNDIIRLFEDLTSCEPGSLPDRGAQLSLERIFDHYWKHDMESELYALIPRDSLLAALHSPEKMSLTVARRFAYQLGVPLFSFISGEAAQCPGVLSANWTCQIPPSFMNIRHRQSRDHQKIRKSLLRYLTSNEVPPSLPDIARQLGTSCGYLEYRFRVVTEKLRAVRKKALVEERQKMLIFARSEVAEFFFHEMEGSNPLSRKEAYRQLKAKTGLPKWVLKGAIQDVYNALLG